MVKVEEAEDELLNLTMISETGGKVRSPRKPAVTPKRFTPR
jgi:hypothetical protein